MVRHGWDWYMGSEMVTTTCVSVTGGVKVGLAVVHLSHHQIEWVWTHKGNSQHLNPPNLSLLVCWMVKQDWDWNSPYITTTKPRLLSHRLWKTQLPWSLHFTPRLCVYGLIQPFHISLTLPISHYKYIEWSGMVEIGIWALKWSPQ